MAHVSDLIATDIDTYLKQHETKSLLRFITCGSVDDGKSTLIGRLLYDSKMIFEDQLAALEADSKKMGTQGQNIDFALLVDGAALAFGGGGEQHFLNDFGQGRRLAVRGTGQRVAAQRAEADVFDARFLAIGDAHPVVIDHDGHAVIIHHGAWRGIIQRHDRDVFQMDVLPDI